MNLRKAAATAIGIIALGAALSACGGGSAAKNTGNTGTVAVAATTTTTPAAFVLPSAKATPNLGMNPQFAEGLVTSGVPFTFEQVAPGIIRGVAKNQNGINLATTATIYGTHAALEVKVVTVYESSPDDGALTTGTATAQLAFDDLVCGAFGTQEVQDWCRTQIDNTTTSSETATETLDQGTYQIAYRFSVSMGYAGAVTIDIKPAP